MGGTELYKPLKKIFQELKLHKNQFKQIFLLTDGAVNDTDEIVNLIKNNNYYNQRLHTFGIGSGVSTDLITECAKAGKGMYYFITNPNDIEKYVINALCTNLIPYLLIKNIKFLDVNKKKVKAIDETIEVANGELFSTKFFIEGEAKIAEIVYTLIDPNTKSTK